MKLVLGGTRTLLTERPSQIVADPRSFKERRSWRTSSNVLCTVVIVAGHSIFGLAGETLDAAFVVERCTGGELAVIVESRGGARGASDARNLDYADGLRVLLARLSHLNVRIADAFVDSRTTENLPDEAKRLQGFGLTYPITIGDASDLQRRLGAAQAEVGREPNAKGSGNRTKRLRLVLAFVDSSPEVAALEAELAGSRADANEGASAAATDEPGTNRAPSDAEPFGLQHEVEAERDRSPSDLALEERGPFGDGRRSPGAGPTASRKRVALDVLKADRLRELARMFEIEVSGYRDRDDLLGGLSDGRRIEFRSILNELTRDELKAMCSALGLDVGGREKSVLIDRLAFGELPRAGIAREDDRPGLASPKPVGATANNLSAAKKREALQVLKAERLRELVRGFGIDVENYRDRDTLISALADGRRLAFGAVLAEMYREEVKAMCAALGLGAVSGKDKSALIERLLRGPTEADDDEAPLEPAETDARDESAIAALARLCRPSLSVEQADRGWPALGSVLLSSGPMAVTIYVRAIGRSGRSRPTERRFQNPADKETRAIREPRTGYALLFGLWDEQGDDRAVIVAMDAYRRLNQDTRRSLFMPMSLLEEAADTGYAEHRSHSGEVLSAFRAQNLPAYVERLALEAGLRADAKPQKEATVPSTVPIVPAPSILAEDVNDRARVQIRPKVGMYAAFARLNYKPWFAIAEFIDNAIQSYLAGSGFVRGEPLLIDLRLDDDEIVITDRAEGIAHADFPRAFSPSQPPPDAKGLSEFGLGMKAAACWFARQWSVRTSARDEPIERTIEFDVPRITRDGIESLPVHERPVPAEDHYTVVTLSNLLVRPKGRTIAKIRDHLSSIYRVLMRNGTVRVRLSTGGATEDLAYATPRLLVAPHFREPEGTPREWKRDFNFTLEPGRRIWGWAGLLETGSVSHAGFSVFRRDRLIQGSADETYRPVELCRKANSYTYQRLVGEIFVEGFDVSHTKDGIQWDGLEEAIVSRLKMDLNSWDFPMLQQAEGYRARRKANDLEPGFGLAAVASTGAVLAAGSIGEVLADQLRAAQPEEARDGRILTGTPPEKTLTKRTFTVNVPHSQLPWSVTLELVSDLSKEWFERGSATKVEERNIQVLVNLAHPFSEQFINDAEATLDPLLRVVCGLVLAEETARESGVRSAGIIRRNLNQLLRGALGARAREQVD